MFNFRRIWHIIRKEFLQLRRDPQLLRIVFIAPVFQLFIFGYAVTTDVENVRMAVLDEDRTPASREFIEEFARSRYFEIKGSIGRPSKIDGLMDAGLVQMVLRIPGGFAGDHDAGRTAKIQVILDGTDSMTAGIIGGYANGVARGYSSKVAAERIERNRSEVGRLPSVEGRMRVWYNPELKSVNYMVPAVLSTILLIVTMLLTSLAIVKEREIGTLEQIIVTPIRKRELMLGKMLPYIAIGFLDMVLILLVAVFWFRISIQGSVTLLFALTAVFIFTNLGLGLFISTISYNQQQAMMATFFIMLPSILLSGFMFPIENMPRVIQWITYAIPLRYFLVIIRGIFLKGNGLAILWPQVAILVVFGLLIVGLSALRFKKRMG